MDPVADNNDVEVEEQEAAWGEELVEAAADVEPELGEEALERIYTTAVADLIGQMEDAAASPRELGSILSLLALYDVPYQHRRPFRALMVHTCQYLRPDSEYSGDVFIVAHSWRLVTEWIRMSPADPNRDNRAARHDLFVLMLDEVPLPSLVLAEVQRLPRREDVLQIAVSPLSDLGLYDRGAEAIVRCGLVRPLLVLAEEFKPRTVAIRSLIALTNIALFPVSHSAFLGNDHEGLRATLGMMGGLSSTNMNELDCALSSCFLVCRVCGTDEHGPGTEYIHSNSLFLSKLQWVLQSVMDSPHRLFMGAHWDPANILYDVCTLSLSDRNKPLLVGFIPLLARCVKELKENARAIEYAVRALMQLVLLNREEWLAALGDDGQQGALRHELHALREPGEVVNLVTLQDICALEDLLVV